MRWLAAAIWVTALPALAVNVTTDAPMAHFKGKDQALFDAALYGLLDKDADGAVRQWKNAETGAGGSVKALKSFTRDGKSCRTVHVANKAGGRTSEADYGFCRSAAGKWTLAQ